MDWSAEAKARLTTPPPNGKPEEEGELPLKNLSFNKRQINSLFIVTDDRKLWIFPHATYGAQEIGVWPEEQDSPLAVHISFMAEDGEHYKLTLKAADPMLFGIVLSKFAAGTQGLMRPKSDSIASIRVEKA